MIVYRKVIRQYVKAIYDYNTDTMSKSLDKSDNYYVDIKVTDPQAKAYLRSFKERNVPLPVSPQILWPQDGINRDDYITNWSFAHVAAVHSGAYGPDSKILHTCDGTYDSCSKQFENIAVASASSCDSDPDYPYFPAPTRYHAILNNIVDAAVAAARARGMGIAVASYEPDVSESKSESAGSASASTNRLRRVYPESEIPSSFRDKLQAPSNGKRPRKLV